jgi:uncharacterized membrane protein
VAVTMMIISMLFTYRVIQLGPLMAPGGVFVATIVVELLKKFEGIKLIDNLKFKSFSLQDS